MNFFDLLNFMNKGPNRRQTDVTVRKNYGKKNKKKNLGMLSGKRSKFKKRI